MAGRDFDINFRTRADSSGAKKVEADLKKVTGATKKNTVEAKKATVENKKLGDSFKGLAAKIPGASKATALFGGLTKGAVGAAAAIGGVVAALTSYLGLVKGGLGKIAIAQDLETSFATLLQSTDKAANRLAELTEFAAKTPFSVSGIADSSRLLEVLAGDALSTGDALREIGDVAAGVTKAGESLDATMQNVSLHVGRLHAALEDGNGEIGVSLLRLQELGVISGRTAERVRELHEQGGRGEEAFAALRKEFARFGGEMERRSATINGRLSNLDDNWSAFQSAVAAPFAEPFRQSIGVINDILQGVTDVIADVNRQLGVTEVTVKGVASAAADLDKLTESLIDIEEAAEKAGEVYAAALEKVAEGHDRINKAQKEELQFIDERAKAYQELAIARVNASNLSDSEKENKIALIEARGTIEQQRRRVAADKAAEARARRRVGFLGFAREEAIKSLRKEEREATTQERADLAEIERLSGSIQNAEARINALNKEEANIRFQLEANKNRPSFGQSADAIRLNKRLQEIQGARKINEDVRAGAAERQSALGLGADGSITGASNRLNKEREDAARARAYLEQVESQIDEARDGVKEATERAARTISIVAAQNQTEVLSLGNQLSDLQNARESIIGFMIRVQEEQKRFSDELARLQLQQKYNRP